MADNQFEILIKFGLSKEKATEAVSELKKLGEQSTATGKEMNKAAEEGAAKFGDVKKSIGLVSAQLGPLGDVLRYVFNPGILGAALLAKLVGAVWEAFQTFMSGLKNSAINAARSIGDIKQAMLDLDIERARADVNFKTSMDDFERHSKRKIEVINLEKDAVFQLLEAREKSELAAAKNPAEQEAIKQRFGSARQTVTEQASAKEAASRASDIKELESKARQRFREGSTASGGRSPEQVKLALKKLPGELKSLDEQIAAQEKVVEELSSITTASGALPYWNDPENYKTQLQAFASSKSTLEKLRNSRKRIASRQLPLTSAETAYDAADSLVEKIRTGREGLTNFQADSLYKNQTDWRASAIASGRGAASDLVSAAASGADAIKSGSKASEDQAKAIAQVTQLLGLTSQSNETILQLLSQMNDTQAKFQQSLNTIQQRTTTMHRTQ